MPTVMNLLDIPNTSATERFGFRFGEKGVHNTRTAMMEDLAVLLRELPSDASKQDYRAAIIDDNTLGKRTASTRKYNAQRLAELYALDPDVTLFRILRHYWEVSDEAGRPLMAMLCALARDPILRMTAQPVLALKSGERFEKKLLEEAIATSAPGRFSETSLAKIARMTGSSWTQSGHLEGRYNKVRARPVATPAAVAYALLLGFLGGRRGGQVFDTFWTEVVDASPERLHELAQEASRRGLLTYRNAGGIIDISFDAVLRTEEQEQASEQN